MHPKVEAVVNLDNLRHNLGCVRALAPHSRVLAVVKADGYGHGARRLLPALASADALAVAHIDEALELRPHTTQAIVVLGGFLSAREWQLCREHAITPVLHEEGQLRLLELGPPAPGSAAWIKLDTGMHRLGFAPAALAAVVARLRRSTPDLALTAMTHLARSEERHHPLTAQQCARFDAANTDGLPASIANSGGIVCWPQARRDWVRPGLMLYGVPPVADYTALRPVMTLRSRVLSVRTVEAGEEVGYNGRWRAPHAATIATVAAGYADGYPTQVPDGAPVLVNGVRARIAGRPSMDMLTLDVSAVPGVRPGDIATLWGEGLPVGEIAAASGIISYQLLTGVSKRVTRIHA